VRCAQAAPIYCSALDEALAQVERSGEKVDLAEILRLKAEVILIHDASATVEAERHLCTALDIARPGGQMVACQLEHSTIPLYCSV
jgi:hypothetical protein